MFLPNIAAEEAHVIVPIPAITMLNEMLVSLETDLPEYEHITQADGSIVACCSFYPSEDALIYSTRQVICGFPCRDSNTSTENAALRSLEYMDLRLHVHLIDYNYEKKEYELDKNRALLNKAKWLTTGMLDIYNIWRSQSVYDLSSVITTLGKAITIPIPPDIPEELHVLVDDLIQSISQVLQRLTEAYTEAINVIDRHEPLLAMTTKTYCRTVM
ncbi:hypothetical protein PR202_ga29910 [Eleusine coracana subsp. coracana]|uniref:Uncharacterized protein n=1 Tax=Eleusine coracana subsp. coracana TaxID=191504 RepID=A0AAV5DKX9_ELECO|nr:hypothetical protein PR202_ga29910 [Eleusine coracana subsp. coracana]